MSARQEQGPLPGIAAAAGLGVLCGLAPPLTWGGAPAAAGVVAVAAIVLLRGGAGRGLEQAAALPPARRWILAALLVAPAIPIAATAARALAAVWVAFPAALWAAPPALLAALVLGRSLQTWSKGAVLVGMAVATALAAGAGARFEAAGPHARGEAFGGPILGIHPFQSTAVAIDGYGPFDLPINDYVEPDGRKGYGPAALAEALERDLRAIAEQQFRAQGPARAYRAFAEAEVEALDLPAARERLDRPPERPTDPRLHVVSGGLGRRSRVEFLCPGTPVDPRPRRPDGVMEAMCPDKYAAEASAGLGLTGRWVGYAELRGQPRASLGRWLGWTRDAVDAEQRALAWLALALVLALAWGPRGRALVGLARAGGALALAVAVLAFLLLVPGWKSQVPALAAATGAPWQVAPWAALLAIGAGPVELGGRRLGWTRALPVAVAGIGLAGGLAAATWLTPDLAPPRVSPPALFGLVAGGRGEASAEDPLLPLEGWVAGLAEGLHARTGIELVLAEALVAAATTVTLLGLLAAWLGPVLRASGPLWAPTRPDRGRRAAGLGVALVAAALVLSRKTAGGAALLVPAAALAWLAGAALSRLSGPGRRGWRIADLVASAALAALAAGEALVGRGSGIMAAACGACLALALASLALVRSPSDAARPGSG